MTTDKGAPAPEIPQEMVGQVAALLIDRGHYRVLDEADAAAWEILEAAGVPALLARVVEVEGALAFYASPENYKPDWHGEEFAPVVRLDRGAKARAALAKKVLGLRPITSADFDGPYLIRRDP